MGMSGKYLTDITVMFKVCEEQKNVKQENTIFLDVAIIDAAVIFGYILPRIR